MAAKLLIVSDIKEEVRVIPKETIALLKKLGVFEYVPKAPSTSLSFILSGAPIGLANGLRRCINSEIEVTAMYVESIDTDDKFIIPQYISQCISMIPVRDQVSAEFNLSVVNNTNEYMNVMSEDIQAPADSMDPGFIICTLKPGKFLRAIIKTKRGRAFVDGAQYSYPGKVGYEWVEFKGSSLEGDPDSIKLTIPEQRYANPRNIVRLGCETLIAKLSRFANVRGVKKKNGHAYKMEGETLTLGNLLADYIKLADPTIGFVAADQHHYMDTHTTLTVQHADPERVVEVAIKKATMDLESIIARIHPAP